MTADVQRELAEALWGRVIPVDITGAVKAGDLAAALLPTVQALIADAEKRAAARALREAADAMSWPDSQNCGPALHARAAALDPSGAALDPSGAAEGAGR